MSHCTECNAIEGGAVYAPEDEDQEIPICACCGMEESVRYVDEDAGQDR